MKNVNYFLGLVLMTIFIIPIYSCQSQIKFNSAEQVADSLALKMNGPNERVKSEWAKTINVLNQRNAKSEELIKVIDKSTNGASAETKELAAILNKFKSINQSDELLINEELFNVFTKQLEDYKTSLQKVFILAEKNKINNSSFHEITVKIEDLEKKIAFQRQKYNEEAHSYNSKIKNNTNDKFYEKYPNLRKKCYFKVNEGVNKAPKIQF